MVMKNITSVYRVLYVPNKGTETFHKSFCISIPENSDTKVDLAFAKDRWPDWFIQPGTYILVKTTDVTDIQKSNK